MSQILIRDIDPEVVALLKGRAKANNRSLEAEVRAVLEDIAERERHREEFLRFAAYARTVNGPQQTDSTEMIREDRER